MTNREKVIDGLVESYKEKLSSQANYNIAKESLNHMHCSYCPFRKDDCDVLMCFKKIYDFIDESEV